MSTIDYKNIDEWLFNYFEGNLRPDETKALTDFLNKNPALKADYDAWKTSYVKEPHIVYPNLDTLLKPQVMFRIKWIRWGVALLVVMALFLFYSIFISEPIKSPAETERPKSSGMGHRKVLQEPITREETSNLEAPKTGAERQLQILSGSSGHHQIQPADQKAGAIDSNVKHTEENLESAFRATELMSKKITRLNDPGSDSSRSIIKQNPEKYEDRKSGRHKKKQKEAKIIRLTNTGF